MATEREAARKAALGLEEAVLLPALPRRAGIGTAALQTALQAAEDMRKKRLGSPVNGSILSAQENGFLTPQARERTGNRAALNHVLCRQKGGPRQGASRINTDRAIVFFTGRTTG